MTSHVAFLRAVNTGNRRITNDELVEAVRALGFDDVSVYQASGNVLLGDCPPDRADEIAQMLEAGLSARLGYDVPAIVRSVAEIRSIASAEPFGGERPNAGSKPQVILMASPADADAVAAYSSDADRLAVIGSEIHWWPTAGISTSDLDVRGLEATFGTMTVRTLGTIQRISARIS